MKDYLSSLCIQIGSQIALCLLKIAYLNVQMKFGINL